MQLVWCDWLTEEEIAGVQAALRAGLRRPLAAAEARRALDWATAIRAAQADDEARVGDLVALAHVLAGDAELRLSPVGRIEVHAAVRRPELAGVAV